MSYGAFSEYKLVRAGTVVPLPSVSKAFIPLIVSGTTAAISLDKVGEIKNGETVMVTAAAGGTGQFAVQWAKQAGCHVIGTCSSEDKVQFLKSLGCDRPINYKTESVKDVLRKEYPDGLDVVYESIGGEMFTTCIKNLAKRGRLIIIGLITSYESHSKGLRSTSSLADLESIPSILLSKSARMSGFFLLDYGKDLIPYCKKLAELCGTGQLQSNTDQGETSPGGPLRGGRGLYQRGGVFIQWKKPWKGGCGAECSGKQTLRQQISPRTINAVLIKFIIIKTQGVKISVSMMQMMITLYVHGK
ncbi:prostaglandin reductase-3-like isoform X2 [Liolophura sinensis]